MNLYFVIVSNHILTISVQNHFYSIDTVGIASQIYLVVSSIHARAWQQLAATSKTNNLKLKKLVSNVNHLCYCSSFNSFPAPERCRLGCLFRTWFHLSIPSNIRLIVFLALSSISILHWLVKTKWHFRIFEWVEKCMSKIAGQGFT